MIRSMRIVVTHTEPGAGRAWQRELAARLPQAEVVVAHDTPDGRDGAGGVEPVGFAAEYAAGWAPGAGFFARQPALRAFFSAGAGVDHLLRHAGLPPALPIVRLEDAGMATLMADYCLHALLHIAGRHDAYAALQAQGRWDELAPLAREALPVGVFGVGVLGGQVARHLGRAGFPVRGFATSPRTIDGVPVLHGDAQWAAFLEGTRVLVLLAPLTPATADRIDRAALDRLMPGGWLVNVARGGLVVDADLLAALDAGRLAGAVLDVFREEPLPPAHPFWRHPRVRLTPHGSAPTQVADSAAQVAAKLLAHARGEPVSGVVERRRGY
jgi:glyoxylate/hydroxypyruvate reductase A